jgi:hypothetical protein
MTQAEGDEACNMVLRLLRYLNHPATWAYDTELEPTGLRFDQDMADAVNRRAS